MLVDIELSTEELSALAWLTNEPSWTIDRKVERIEMNVWRSGRRFNTQTPAGQPVAVALAKLALQAKRLLSHFEAVNNAEYGSD